MTRFSYQIRPRGFLIDIAELPLAKPRLEGLDPVPAERTLQLPRRPEQRIEWQRVDDNKAVAALTADIWGPDIARLAEIMSQPMFESAIIEFGLQRLERTAQQMRSISTIYHDLVRVRETHAKDPIQRAWLDERLALLAPWYEADAVTRLNCTISTVKPLSDMALDLVSDVLYGSCHSPDAEISTTYLADCWPGTRLAFLKDLPAIASARRHLVRRRRRRSASTRDGIRLGACVEDSTPAVLELQARSQHLYVIGGTGTGKSTLLAQMIAQDMERGEAVVVIDPHGKLVEDVARLVPPRRRGDVVLLHPTDPAGKFTLNVLAPLGPDLALERNRSANDLLAFMKMLYPEPREAFGPMFQNYYRNAVFLVLAGREKEATLHDVRRVFIDQEFRRALKADCPDKDVKQFWDKIAGESGRSDEYAQIENVAPYIDAKLSQLSGNPLIARIIGHPQSSIDFADVSDNKRICLVNLALNEIGDEDARVLGSLLFGHLTRQLKSSAAGRDACGLPLRVYLDEVQTYADERLAQSMAQMRKFGVCYTLANQNLAQVAGGSWRPGVLQEIISNCANLLAFRIAHQDAVFLKPWFGDGLPAERLIGLPNYQAAARLLVDNAPLDPFVLRTDPPAA